MNTPYDDIIDMPHHVSEKRKHMSLDERAAQFAPFAALTGYDSDIREASRLVCKKIELDEYAIAELDEKLRFLKTKTDDAVSVTVTYFKSDGKKQGGVYTTVSGVVEKIDEYEKNVLMSDGVKIPIYDIYAIEGDVFC